MSRRESGLRHYISKGLRPYGHVVAVENGSADPGTPDANGCILGNEFWIELKRLDAWPARDSTIVKIGLRPEQRTWMDRRAHAGGRCFVVLQVKKEWALFLWKNGQKPEDRTRNKLNKVALRVWRNRVDFEELAKLLTAYI